MLEVRSRVVMTAALVAGLLAGYGIAVPVGAVASYLVVLTARTSWRVGAAAGLGVATADGLYALAAVVGGSVLAVAIHPVAAPLRLLSAVVLLVLATQVARTGLRSFKSAEPGGAVAVLLTPAQAYRRLVAVTIVNPTTVVYFTALVAGHPGGTLTSIALQLLFVTAAAAASASWQLLLVSGGALLGRAVTSRRGQLVTALSSSAIIASLAFHNVSG